MRQPSSTQRCPQCSLCQLKRAPGCRATPHFQQLRKRIDDVITQDYGAALEYAAIFEEHRKVYDFGRTWSFDSYSGKKK